MGDFQVMAYQGRNAPENVQLLKESEKITTGGFFISTLPHVKLIAETHVYTCHKSMQSMGIFLQFLESFRGKYIYNILQEMKYGLSLRQKQLLVVMYYIIT